MTEHERRLVKAARGLVVALVVSPVVFASSDPNVAACVDDVLLVCADIEGFKLEPRRDRAKA